VFSTHSSDLVTEFQRLALRFCVSLRWRCWWDGCLWGTVWQRGVSVFPHQTASGARLQSLLWWEFSATALCKYRLVPLMNADFKLSAAPLSVTEVGFKRPTDSDGGVCSSLTAAPYDEQLLRWDSLVLKCTNDSNPALLKHHRVSTSAWQQGGKRQKTDDGHPWKHPEKPKNSQSYCGWQEELTASGCRAETLQWAGTHLCAVFRLLLYVWMD